MNQPCRWDNLWVNAQLVTMSMGQAEYGLIENGAIATTSDRISWLGSMASLPAEARSNTPEVIDVKRQCITPGLIDCHTHLVYGGNRAREFELRLKGASYEELLQGGGGILSTVNATRKASEKELLVATKKRAAALQREGVTTIEIKSGYGLDIETELKMLRVARLLGAEDPLLDVRATFLGAHALPPEYALYRAAYIQLVVDEMLSQVYLENLADAVDGFCETIAFSPEEIEQVFDRACELGLQVKLHADQLSDLGGAALAARYGALSADHLEYTSEAGVEALSRSRTVAVLLPGAFYTLKETQPPPVDLLRRYRVPIAIATDANPGSSPVLSLLLMLNMACTLFSLTSEEALAGVTRNAAQALGLLDDRGTLEVGKRADFVIWDIDHPSELAYMIGANPCAGIVKNGRIAMI